MTSFAVSRPAQWAVHQVSRVRHGDVTGLDNHDDFGGHAKRNEFHHRGRMYLGYGGTMSIEAPFPYSYIAKALIRELGIDLSSR